jgi:GH15 family glucan-1,4-alpha-glucosidase
MPVVQEDDADLQPERELLRIVEALDGEPEIEVVFAPRPDYGRTKVALEHRGSLGWAISGPGTLVLLRSDIEMKPADGDVLRGTVRIPKGERRYLSLSFASRDTAVIPPLGEECDRKLDRAVAWWRGWSSACTYDGPYREIVLRSVLALKLLQFCLSGAVIAAPTSSLPEAIGAERNWDYRYCWLRDAAFTLEAFTDTGFYSEGTAFFDWMMHATWLTQPKLQALYDVYGRTDLAERTLAHLSGYRNSKPVRIGNGAHDQLQLDVYGSVVAAANAFVNRGNRLYPAECNLLARFGETVCNMWRQPDNGIWEYRASLRHNTWSKVMCWSVLSDLLRMDEQGVLSVDRDRFGRERDTIARDILDHSYDKELGSFTGAYGERFLDATLLLLPAYGFVKADDPRMVGTWKQIQKRLQNGYIIRRYDEGTDEFSGSEGGFVICSFWAVDYLARAGRIAEAREHMDGLLAYASDIGLMSEEIEAANGLMLGNFPQAFSHSGLINAALVLADVQKRKEKL